MFVETLLSVLRNKVLLHAGIGIQSLPDPCSGMNPDGCLQGLPPISSSIACFLTFPRIFRISAYFCSYQPDLISKYWQGLSLSYFLVPSSDTSCRQSFFVKRLCVIRTSKKNFLSLELWSK